MRGEFFGKKLLVSLGEEDLFSRCSRTVVKSLLFRQVTFLLPFLTVLQESGLWVSKCGGNICDNPFSRIYNCSIAIYVITFWLDVRMRQARWHI